MELAEQDDAGVGGGVQEEGDELGWGALKGSMEWWEKMGVRGEEVEAVGEGGGHGWGEGGTGAGEQVL